MSNEDIAEMIKDLLHGIRHELRIANLIKLEQWANETDGMHGTVNDKETRGVVHEQIDFFKDTFYSDIGHTQKGYYKIREKQWEKANLKEKKKDD